MFCFNLLLLLNHYIINTVCVGSEVGSTGGSCAAIYASRGGAPGVLHNLSCINFLDGPYSNSASCDISSLEAGSS